MDLKLFKETASEQPLILELQHEGTFHVDSFHVLDQTNFFTSVDLLIVFKQFVDYFLKHCLLSLFLGLS